MYGFKGLLLTFFVLAKNTPSVFTRIRSDREVILISVLLISLFNSNQAHGFFGFKEVITAGPSHTCAINDLTTRCWGDGYENKTDVPRDLKDVQQVSAGLRHTCAIGKTGVKCWGNNEFGQTTVPNNLHNPRQISSGGNQSCVLDDGGVKCWGDNEYGQLNVRKGLKNLTQVSVGRDHVCVIANKKIKCWGDNRAEQASVPEGLVNIQQISAGDRHTCAIHEKRISCWGRGYYDNDYHKISSLAISEKIKDPQQISAGKGYTCAIDKKGLLFCWGDDPNGYGHTVVPEDLGRVYQVTASHQHTCALTVNGIKCWGRQDHRDDILNSHDTIKNPQDVAVGQAHVCVTEEKGVLCWGFNVSGQTQVPKELANPTKVFAFFNTSCAIDEKGPICWGDDGSDNDKFILSEEMTASDSLSLGDHYACAIIDNSVKCSGSNYHFRDGVNILSTLKNPRKVTVGYNFACALDDNGVRCWGNNKYKQLEVPNFLETPLDISSGSLHACALTKKDIVCWGYNEFGQLDVPENIKNPYKVFSGHNNTCALDIEGLKCWGSDYMAMLHLPTNLKNPRKVSIGDNMACALDDEGLKCWGGDGYNFYPKEGFSYKSVKSKLFISEDLLPLLKKTSPPLKSYFYSLVENYIESKPRPDQEMALSVITFLLKASIEDTDSINYTNFIIPEHRKLLERIKIETTENIKIEASLKAISSALKTSLKIYTGEEKLKAMEMLKVVTQAIGDVENTSNINTTFLMIKENMKLINKLSDSKKTQFLPMTIGSSMEYLSSNLKGIK